MSGLRELEEEGADQKQSLSFQTWQDEDCAIRVASDVDVDARLRWMAAGSSAVSRGLFAGDIERGKRMDGSTCVRLD